MISFLIFMIGQLAFDVVVLFILGVNIKMWTYQREVNALLKEVIELIAMPHTRRKES